MGKLLFPAHPAARLSGFFLLDFGILFVYNVATVGLTYVVARSLETCDFGINGLPVRPPPYCMTKLSTFGSMWKAILLSKPKASCRSEGAGAKRADVAADRSSRKGSAAGSGTNGNTLVVVACHSCPVCFPLLLRHVDFWRRRVGSQVREV